MLFRSGEAVEKLMAAACELIENREKIALFEKNAAAMAKMDAAQTIAEEIYKIIG